MTRRCGGCQAARRQHRRHGQRRLHRQQRRPEPIGSRFLAAESLPGTPARTSFADTDAGCSRLAITVAVGPGLSAGERMFVAIFGMRRTPTASSPGRGVCVAMLAEHPGGVNQLMPTTRTGSSGSTAT